MYIIILHGPLKKNQKLNQLIPTLKYSVHVVSKTVIDIKDDLQLRYSYLQTLCIYPFLKPENAILKAFSSTKSYFMSNKMSQCDISIIRKWYTIFLKKIQLRIEFDLNCTGILYQKPTIPDVFKHYWCFLIAKYLLCERIKLTY